ncbi:gp26 [Brochothrix phage BL3]|uniref:gp26 n=1 Tax=Brochothrix phage BL3 TaxID=764562 RepID=UPI0001D9ADC3|nr:gp26 [Brochothrix phage BL3]ADH03107.1 gp26 [Brochothrix phage BL3]SLM97045.1 MloA [Brachybacterium faecium]
MPIRGIELLPPKVSMGNALKLYQKVASIKSKVGRLNSELSHSIINSQLIQIFTLQESVQSTRIEGTQVTFADMVDSVTKKNKPSKVKEVDNYMLALEEGVERIQLGAPITTSMIRDLHDILMDGGRGTTSAKGEFRKIQNFIGPSKKIEEAVYIPIGAHEIGNYMTNLEYYINNTDHNSFEGVLLDDNEIVLDYNADTLIKTAIMHAQFESIHPFLDGNGRMGRILIVLNTMQDKLIDKPVFFVSEELEKERLRYYNLLNGTRGESPEWFAWIDFFLDACERMTDVMLQKLDSITDLTEKGLRLINSRNKINHVWLSTFSAPYITVSDVAEKLNIAQGTARKCLNELVDLGLLDVDNSKRKNKVYVNYDLMRILN